MRILAFLLAPVIGACAEGVQWPELRGLVHIDGADNPAAVLVLPKSAHHWAILRAGDTDPGLDFGNIEVASIDPMTGVVRLRHRPSSDMTEVKLASLKQGQEFLIHLEQAPLATALECYQRLSGRTVIHSPQLSNAELDVHIPADQDKKAALAALANAVEVHDSALIEHAEKYAFAVPARHRQLVASLPAIPPPSRTGDPKQDVLWPPGLIRFASADVLQVIEFYSDLSGRAVLRPSYFPHSRVTLRSQTPLNRAEALWMLEAALRLGGLSAIPVADKFVFLVPPERAEDLPAFDPARKLPGEAGLMKLVAVDRLQLLEAYAALTGRKALPLEANVPHAKFTLRSPLPLSRAEAAFALEAVAVLNGLALQPVGANEVRLLPLATARLQTN